jgi:hypothetical protein
VALLLSFLSVTVFWLLIPAQAARHNEMMSPTVTE